MKPTQWEDLERGAVVVTSTSVWLVLERRGDAARLLELQSGRVYGWATASRLFRLCDEDEVIRPPRAP